MSELRYILTLRPMPVEKGGPPPILRLRRLLKFAKRSCQLQCTDHREVIKDDEVTTNEK